jgi:hypothetical protein
MWVPSGVSDELVFSRNEFVPATIWPQENGQSFCRQSDECWQVVSVQESADPTDSEKSLTVNIAVDSKYAMEFRREDLSRLLDTTRVP